MAYSISTYGDGHPSLNAPARWDKVRYVVVHYTANGNPLTPGAARNNCAYFSGGNRNASAHYFIDDSSIWCFADPATHSCWHVGDGGGAYGITNQNSVGIEVVQDGNSPFSAEEVRKLRWLVLRLMRQFGVPAERVVRHYDASRKLCPWYYTPQGAGGDAAWRQLHAEITRADEPTISAEATQPKTKAKNKLGLRYRVHQQGYGWLPSVCDGQTAGVTGQSRRVEAIKITPPEGVELSVEFHAQGRGWLCLDGIRKGRSSGTGSSMNDPIIGTVGEHRRLEAIRVHVTRLPKSMRGKKLRLQSHVQGRGWLPVVGEGEVCGTTGESRRLEAIRMWFE